MNLTEICIRKPVAAWMILLAVVAVGAISSRTIGVSLFPDVDRPTLQIWTGLAGAAPEVIERDVVEPIEERLAQAEGVRSIVAECRRGQARITVELELGRDVDDALQDVQNRISGIRGLPRDLEPISINKSNPEDDDLLWLSLNGPFSPQVLSDTARYTVADRLQTLVGVGEVRINGASARNLRIWLDADRMAAVGLTPAEIVAAVRRNHVELPAGTVSNGTSEINVRILGEAADVGAFRQMVVAERAGRTVRLGDVALVEDGFEDQRRSFRVDGERSINIGVRKQRGANAVAVAEAVRERMAAIQRVLPPGMALTIVFDNSRIITDSVHEMWRELITAVALTALVCWLFLGSFAAAGNVLLAVPMSLLGTVAVMQALGMTLNTFTMLGLALAIGLVVDDAIMVQENIHRHREGVAEGDRRGLIAAARRGTREIRGAALAATAAVIAIFAPVFFLKGEIGRFFLSFGIAMAVAVAFSYVEAVTLAPARLAYMPHHPGRTSWLGRVADALFAALSRWYAAVLGGVLRRPWTVSIATVLLCALGIAAAAVLPRELLPPQDSGAINIRVNVPSGTDFDTTDRTAARVDEVLRGRPDVQTSATVVFTNTFFFARVRLVEKDQRKPGAAVMQEIRSALAALPGVASVSVEDGAPQVVQSGPGGGRKPVEVVFLGDGDDLAAAATAFRNRLEADRERFRNVAMDYRPGQPEVRIVPDRDRAADLGVSMDDIATTVNSLVGSTLVGTTDLDGRRQDIRIRLRADQRDTPEDLKRIQIRARSGELVPLAAVVSLDERPVPLSIFRRDRERAITVRADNGAGIDEVAAQAAAMALVGELPAGVRAVPGSGVRVLDETFSSLWIALALGLAASYMVLAAQYNALIHPLVILAVLPMAAAGGCAALWLTGASLNAFSAIGLLLLMGIAKKNSILLVDAARYRQLEDEKLGAAEAMRIAGPLRLRPILMTSLATLMAAVPIALGTGPGAESRAPMAIAVLGGVALSTALSLVAVPALYVLVAGRRR